MTSYFTSVESLNVLNTFPLLDLVGGSKSTTTPTVKYDWGINKSNISRGMKGFVSENEAGTSL